MSLTIKVELDDQAVEKKLTNDRFGLFVAHEWKRLIDPYTPRDIGLLMSNVEEKPFLLHYHEPYAHYQYMGEVYVDPDYGVAGWYSDDYGWWSRPNVPKVPSGRSLTYNKKNPYATDHWDQKAAQAGQADKLVQTINNYLQRGII